MAILPRIVTRFRSFRKSLREKRGSLAWLIATRVSIGLASFFVIFNTLVIIQERAEIRKQSRALLAETNLYVSLRFHDATARVFDVLESIDLEIQQTPAGADYQRNQFSGMQAILPFVRIQLSTANSAMPEVEDIGKSQILLEPQQSPSLQIIGQQRNKKTFISYTLNPSSGKSLICFNLRSKNQTRVLGHGEPPVIISACWTARDLIQYVGYQQMIPSTGQPVSAVPFSSLDGNASLRGTSGLFLLAGSNGNLFLPQSQQLIKTKQQKIVSFATASEVKYFSRDWLEISQYMRRFHSAPMGSTKFDSITVHGQEYLIQALRLGPYWSSAILLPASTAYSAVRGNLLILLFLQLSALLIVMLILFSTSTMIAQPISKAIVAIEKMSIGESVVDLPDKASGELQSLYDSIRLTSTQLKLLVADKLSNALRNQQLTTAREIQKNFLPADSLETTMLSVAASFTPAYEIGADWYDIIEVAGHLFVVIADVCDKGVPSALFMSVFRTLLRYTLEDVCATETLSVDFILRNALERVNIYMADKHGQQAMFATVFMAAFDPAMKNLHFVSAGHEPAQLLSADAIEELKPSGPAIGIFPGAKYTSHSVVISEGDILFAYTDGLTDAVNSQQERWGKERMQSVLHTLAGTRDAKDVINAMQTEVTHYIEGCSQFDDLTLLALVVRT